MSSLLDKSLVRSSGSGSGDPLRLTMLETLREFALEQLRNAGEEELLRARHAEYFLAWVERSYRAYFEEEGARQQLTWVRRLDEEAENLRAAMSWFGDVGRSGSVARMGLAMWRHWWVRNQSTAAAAWMQGALASASLDERERALAQFVLGVADVGRSDFVRALPSLAAANAALERLGDEEHAALAGVLLGAGVAVTRDAGEGERIVRRALETFRTRGDVWGAAFAMFGLGVVLLMQGRVDDTISVEEEGAASLRAAGELVLRSMILVTLGWALVAGDRVERANVALEEALGISTTMQDRDGIARALDALGAVSSRRGDPRRGALLFGAAEGVRRSVGGRVWVIDQVPVAGLEAERRRTLGDDDFERAFAEGVALPIERVVKLATARGWQTRKRHGRTRRDASRASEPSGAVGPTSS
jgi:non-specific serine/threonine protein kinase